MSRLRAGSGPAVDRVGPTPATTVLVYCYFLLAPVYLWESGLPQVADGVLIVLVVLRIVTRLKNGVNHGTSIFSFPSSIVCFAFYVAVVNFTAAILVGDASFVRVTLFYVYNALVAVTVYGLVRQYGAAICLTMFRAAALSLTVQLLALAAQGGLAGAGRQVAGFNNPNQLGAFAVLMYTIVLGAAGSSRVQAFLAGALLPVSALLVMASLSRAGMLTLPILATAYILYLRRSELASRDRWVTLLAVSTALLVAWLMVREQITSGLLGAVDDRWGVQKADSTLSGRGYDRIADHPEFWLFGGGEGANYRFGVRIELHSGPGTLIYAYGAVGVVLFLAIIYYALKGNGVFGVVVLAAPIVYGLTHQVLRDTLLWIFLAMLGGITVRLHSEFADRSTLPVRPKTGSGASPIYRRD